MGGAGTVFGFLAEHREEVFPASEFAGMFDETMGRPSVAPSSMAAAMVLQVLCGLSDRKAAEALTFDLRWKAACGLAVDAPAFDRTTFILNPAGFDCIRDAGVIPPRRSLVLLR